MQLGTKQRKTLQEVVSEHQKATQNKARGLAFEFDTPQEYLLATIGSAMFVEPKFYTDAKNLEELKERQYNVDGLDEQAIQILNACFKVAEGDNPRDLLALAHWARKELNMRTTPQVMLAVAAYCPKTKPFVRKYVSNISTRADEVKQVVGAYEHLFGWGAFPACLKKGVSDRMSQMSEYEILKYNTKDHPSFADLLRFCERRKNYPFSQELREYVLTGEVVNPEATPMVAARKSLNSMTEWSDEVPRLARAAGATWENLVSQFGSKPEVWELAASQMGYMALLRNLANFLDANVSVATVNRIAEKLADPEKVAASKQLPFRFLSAFRTLSPARETYGIYRLQHQRQGKQRDRGAWNADKLQVLSAAVEAALECSINRVPDMPGNTLIAADNSGSMSNMLSANSILTIRDVANVLCAILHKRCDNVQVVSFGEKVVPITMSHRSSVLANAKEVETQHNRGGGGHSTNAWRVIDYALRSRAHYDRVVILSDMQCYDTTGGFHSGGRSVAASLANYRSQVNSKCFAHFFDLLGAHTRQTAPGNELDNVVAGFSEKIFDQILLHESGVVDRGDSVAVEQTLPSLDYIRENF